MGIMEKKMETTIYGYSNASIPPTTGVRVCIGVVWGIMETTLMWLDRVT